MQDKKEKWTECRLNHRINKFLNLIIKDVKKYLLLKEHIYLYGQTWANLEVHEIILKFISSAVLYQINCNAFGKEELKYISQARQLHSADHHYVTYRYDRLTVSRVVVSD